MDCPKCATPRPEDAAFCPECGYKYGVAVSAVPMPVGMPDNRDELLRLREENLRLREERLTAASEKGKPADAPPVINVHQKNEGLLSGCAGSIGAIFILGMIVSQCAGK